MRKRTTNPKIYHHNKLKPPMLDDVVKKRVDSKKPRKEGLTYVVEKFHGLEKDGWEIIAPFVDVVKINGALPLFATDAGLSKRIKFYHDLGVNVSTGSTSTEFAIVENTFERFVKEAKKIGFDIVEVGESISDLIFEKKKKFSDIVKSHDLDLQWKVGKRDPRHQMNDEEMLEKIGEAVKLESSKIILEANQGYNVGIYDENGLPKWGTVATLTNQHPPNMFIFETPLEAQQSALVAEFGERVNLAEIEIDSVISVESQRCGILSKASFSSVNIREDPEGGPAAKFIYYIIKTKNPIEQSELIRVSYLPRRTVQHAIEDLKRQGLIVERSSLDDARKRIYYPVRSEWL